MKILIIEDEEGLAKLLKKGLEGEGYAVDHLLDGESGQKRIELNLCKSLSVWYNTFA